MDRKDIKLGQYYRVKFRKDTNWGNHDHCAIGYFIESKHSADVFDSIFLFNDIALMNHGTVYQYFLDSYDIESIEEFDEVDLEEELFINGL